MLNLTVGSRVRLTAAARAKHPWIGAAEGTVTAEPARCSIVVLWDGIGTYGHDEYQLEALPSASIYAAGLAVVDAAIARAVLGTPAPSTYPCPRCYGSREIAVCVPCPECT
jgi:hypothetical protein